MSCCQGCWDRPQPELSGPRSRCQALNFFLENEAGTSKLQIYSSSRQASWVDPGTVFRTQEVSCAPGCGRSTASFLQSWLARAFHRACPGWLIRYQVLPNVDLDKGLFGFSFSPLKKIVRKYFSWNKGAFSNEDPCTVKPNHDTMADVVSSSVEEPVSQTT